MADDIKETHFPQAEIQDPVGSFRPLRLVASALFLLFGLVVTIGVAVLSVAVALIGLLLAGLRLLRRQREKAVREPSRRTTAASKSFD